MAFLSWITERWRDPPQSLVFNGHSRLVARVDEAIFEVDPKRGFTLYLTTPRIGSPIDAAIVFGLVSYPVPDELMRFLGSSAPPTKSGLRPATVIYAGFHDRPTKVVCRITKAEEHHAEFELAFEMKDLRYYDERAKPTRVRGRFRARLGDWDEMKKMPI